MISYHTYPKTYPSFSFYLSCIINVSPSGCWDKHLVGIGDIPIQQGGPGGSNFGKFQLRRKLPRAPHLKRPNKNATSEMCSMDLAPSIFCKKNFQMSYIIKSYTTFCQILRTYRNNICWDMWKWLIQKLEKTSKHAEFFFRSWCRICNCLHKEGIFNTISHPRLCNSIDSSSTKNCQLYPLPLFMLFGNLRLKNKRKPK